MRTDFIVTTNRRSVDRVATPKPIISIFFHQTCRHNSPGRPNKRNGVSMTDKMTPISLHESSVGGQVDRSINYHPRIEKLQKQTERYARRKLQLQRICL